MGESVLRFFNTHKESLESWYPGIHRDLFIQKAAEILENLSFNEFEKLCLEGTPFEQQLGKAFFYESSFFVDKNVLIPRSETEILVDYVRKRVTSTPSKDKLSLMDFGTGTGCILLSLLMSCGNITSSVGVDISSKALSIARKNEFHLKFRISSEQRCSWREGERAYCAGELFDIITSNPPYIPLEEKEFTIHKQVNKYEPALALFVPDRNYYKWFDQLIDDFWNSLQEGGFFIMEGHEDYLKNIQKRVDGQERWQKVSLMQDLTGRDRFLIGEKNNG